MQSIAACDCATLQIQHRIGNAHGGFTVRDQHHSHVLPLIRILLALGQLMNGTQNDGFIQGIQTTGRLVEEHQVGIAQEYTGQADALAFAFRQSVAQLAHLGVEPIRQGIDQVEHGWPEYGGGHAHRFAVAACRTASLGRAADPNSASAASA